MLIAADVAQHPSELIDPTHDIILRKPCPIAKTGVAHHFLTRYVHLLPAPEVCEQFHMETLIAIFFRGIDIIGYASRFFPESVGQDGIYFKRYRLLISPLGSLEYHIGEMAVFKMVEIIAIFFHLAPYAVRLAILHHNTRENAGLGKGCLYLASEPVKTHPLLISVVGNER